MVFLAVAAFAGHGAAASVNIDIDTSNCLNIARLPVAA
jgi:hypothetical protein